MGRRLCNPHYLRWKKHGDPLGGKPGPKVRAVVIHADGTKDCTDCGERLPSDQFHKDTRSPSGYRSQCKPCRIAKVTDWYNNDSEKIRARKKVYYEANGDEIRARDAARYERDKTKRLALATDAVHRRRARISDSTPDKGINHSSLRDRDGSLCHLCDREMSFEVVRKGEYNPRRATIEHLLPLCAGGTHTWNNVALTCWECNLRRPKKVAV